MAYALLTFSKWNTFITLNMSFLLWIFEVLPAMEFSIKS